MSNHRLLARNSVANLIRAASAGLLAVVLPAVLVRTLPPEAYAAWALVLQTAAYITLLDLGLQFGIGRFIARETVLQNDSKKEEFFFSGAAALAACGLIALLATLFLAALLPYLFPRIDPALVLPSRIAILLIGGSTAVSLPGSAVVSLFIGLERYWIPALSLGAGRLFQCGLVTAVAVTTHDLVAIAASFALGNLLIQVIYLFCLRRFGPSMKFHRTRVVRSVLRELAGYCGSVSTWTVAMLLVSGLDVAIVAEVNFQRIPAYSICANLIALLSGLVGSALNVLIPRSSAMDGVGDHEGIARLLIKATQVCTLGLLTVALFGALLAKPLLTLWVGPTIAADALPILLVLIGANALRLTMTPYANILLGTGEQKWATWTALVEGSVNLGASVLLGRSLGAIGVAYGTLIGAFVGVSLAIGYTMPNATRIGCRPARFTLEGLLFPALCLTPLLPAAWAFSALPAVYGSLALLLGVAGVTLLIVRRPFPEVRA